MTWHLKRLTDAPAIQWKNGGGLTRELMAWPESQAWAWRMSVAEIARSGPFSAFDGVERWFAVLSGAGVQLDVGMAPAAAVYKLTPDAAPLCFAGEAQADCALTLGAAQAFNLMLRRGSAQGRMLRVVGDFSTELDASKTIAFYALSTGASVLFDDERLELPANTLAWRDCPSSSRLQVCAAHALWIEITC
jgi:environmental stress-induced protein Ves